MAADPRIILASGSTARATMLRAAGVPFDVVPAEVDEAVIRHHLAGQDRDITPISIASALAEAKAAEVSNRNPNDIVIGADQVLALGNELLTKATDVGTARATLIKLRGRMHELHSAAAIVNRGQHQAIITDSAKLHVREFSDAFLDSYLATAGDALTSCVGCYKLEDIGLQLFEKIEGDYHTILGMPLLPLLRVLRDLKAIPA